MAQELLGNENTFCSQSQKSRVRVLPLVVSGCVPGGKYLMFLNLASLCDMQLFAPTEGYLHVRSASMVGSVRSEPLSAHTRKAFFPFMLFVTSGL